jgi:hypothetical protein
MHSQLEASAPRMCDRQRGQQKGKVPSTSHGRRAMTTRGGESHTCTNTSGDHRQWSSTQSCHSQIRAAGPCGRQGVGARLRQGTFYMSRSVDDRGRVTHTCTQPSGEHMTVSSCRTVYVLSVKLQDRDNLAAALNASKVRDERGPLDSACA